MDAIDADVVAAEFLGQILGGDHQRALRRRIAGLTGERLAGGHGVDHGNGAATGLLHGLDRLLGQGHGADDVGVEALAPVVEIGGLDTLEIAMVESAVDQSVDATKARFGRRHQSLALASVGDVGWLLQYLAIRGDILHAPLGVRETGCRASSDGDMGAFAGRFDGQLDAEAGADTRNNDDLVVQ